MAAEEVLKLFDMYWFEHEIFTRNPFSPPNEINQIEEEIQESKFSHLPSLQVRSFSEQNLSSKASLASDSLSPTSPKLQSIPSGKVVTEFESKSDKQEDIEAPIKPGGRERRSRGGGRRNRGGGSNSSKSLTDLEFEELKGFMDLGFVFSEEDKNSSLVSIIPGLQRLGRKSGEDEQKEHRKIDKSSVQRPYLSEAWDVLDIRKEKPLLIDWRIPILGSEMDIKGNLRFWAHTVASRVR